MMANPGQSLCNLSPPKFIVLAISLGLSTSVLLATQPMNDSGATVQGNAKQSAGDPTQVDQESEAKATQLVATHLPQLKNILRRLRESEPQEYAKAVRDLARSAKKLEFAESRTDGGFEVELQLLKTQTEVNLLTARLRVRDSTRDRKQLRSALTRLQTAQLERTKYEVQLLRDRLGRTQKQLALAEQRLQSKQQISAEQFEKSYSRLIRKAGRELTGERDTKSSRNSRRTETESEDNTSKTPVP